MLVWWILGVLAAFGAFCALWAAFGWLLPVWRGCVLVCICKGQTEEARALLCWRWLRGLGLIKAPLLMVGSGLSADPDVEFCTLEALPSRLEQERDRFG